MRTNTAVLALIPFCFATTALGNDHLHYRYVGNDPGRWSASRVAGRAASGRTTYTTYIGDQFPYRVAAIATDSGGNTYVTGSRIVSSAPSTWTSEDVFVAKLDAAGNTLFTATIGGKRTDQPTALAVDSAGNIYVAGTTSSPNFPVRNAIRSQFGTSGDAFLFKLGPDGSQLLYSTYIGGLQGFNFVAGLAVDPAQDVYLAGSTQASDFPQTLLLGPAPTSTSLSQIGAAFVMKIAPAGDKVVYSVLMAGKAKPCAGSSCFLSGRYTSGAAVALDASGNAYLAGNAYVTDLSTTPGALRATGIGAFVAKINATGTGLAYLTYLGAGFFSAGPGPDPYNKLSAIAVDAAGEAYVTGSTWDLQFPITPGAYQTTISGSRDGSVSQPDAFVGKLSADGSAMAWASFLGGTGKDAPSSIAIDSAGDAWVVGTTTSPDFPNTNGASNGGDFLVAFNASGSALRHAARYPNGSVSQAVSVDTAGLLHAAGTNGIVSTFDANQPPTTRILGVANAAYGDAGGRVAAGEVISVFGSLLGPVQPAQFAVDASGKVPATLAGVQVSFDGIPAPLLYVSATQVNAVVPFGLAGRTTSHLYLTFNGNGVDLPVAVVPAEPEIFRKSDGTAAALNQDGSFNSQAHPAAPASIVSIWATGIRTSGTDGQIATGPRSSECCTSVWIGYGQTPQAALYSGAAPGLVAGVIQVNFQVPANPPGFIENATQIPVSVMSADQSGSAAMLWVGGPQAPGTAP